MVELPGVELIIHSRKPIKSINKSIKYLRLGNIDKNTFWVDGLRDIDTVIHCAAKAHVINKCEKGQLNEFREINVHGTLKLARESVLSGVKRFIYISSIGVNGIETKKGCVFTEEDKPNPQNSYGISKLEAEEGLRLIAKESNLEVVIIRPPLIYGPNAPGNFGALLRALQKGIPLPFGGIGNQRSFVALDNLVDFIILCTSHPKAANQTFLISDGQDISTSELLVQMIKAGGYPNRIFYAPMSLIISLMYLFGCKEKTHGLYRNLQVDITKARDRLGWIPPLPFAQAIHRAVSKYE
jgi:UDP-glucose 4-epimerase